MLPRWNKTNGPTSTSKSGYHGARHISVDASFEMKKIMTQTLTYGRSMDTTKDVVDAEKKYV